MHLVSLICGIHAIDSLYFLTLSQVLKTAVLTKAIAGEARPYIRIGEAFSLFNFLCVDRISKANAAAFRAIVGARCMRQSSVGA
jgi:hypothetical protein